jgi:hypothetical protein
MKNIHRGFTLPAFLIVFLALFGIGSVASQNNRIASTSLPSPAIISSSSSDSKIPPVSTSSDFEGALPGSSVGIVTIDQSSLSSTQNFPTLTGSAQNVSTFYLSILGADSWPVSVVNGKWISVVIDALKPGTYTVEALTQGSLLMLTSAILTVNPVTSTTTMYTNSQLGISVRYPASFANSYARLNNVTAFATQAGSLIDSNGCYSRGLTRPNDSQITINNMQFCQSDNLSPGAGTVSGYYYFTTYKNGEYVTLAYEAGYPNGCGAVEGTSQYKICEDSLPDAINDLVKVIRQSAGTLTFTN